MSQRFFDPTAERAVEESRLTARVASLDGKVVCLLDISKSKGDIFLDRLEELLKERYRPKAIIRKMKPTFSKPAPGDLREEILKAADVVVEGLAD